MWRNKKSHKNRRSLINVFAFWNLFFFCSLIEFETSDMGALIFDPWILGWWCIRLGHYGRASHGFLDKKCRNDDNGLHMLLALEFLAMGSTNYWSSKDAMERKWCLLDGLHRQVTFERKWASSMRFFVLEYWKKVSLMAFFFGWSNAMMNITTWSMDSSFFALIQWFSMQDKICYSMTQCFRICFLFFGFYEHN